MKPYRFIMNKFIKIACVIILCATLFSCDISNEEYQYEEYEEGYSEGYADGYEDGWEDLNEIAYDELDYEIEKKTEVLRLMFEAVYDGAELKDGITYYAGNFGLRYHIEDNEYLCFDIKFTDFDIKTFCNSFLGDKFLDYELPISCYIGFYNEYNEYEVHEEYFAGEQILFGTFEFTTDGYLTDYCKLTDYYTHDSIDGTLYVLLFVDGEVYAATYSVK